jgi:hypothetical protein
MDVTFLLRTMSPISPWIWLPIQGGLAIAFLGATIWRAWSRWSVAEMGRLSLTCVCCIIVLGSGFSIQPLTSEALNSNPLSLGPLYNIEFAKSNIFETDLIVTLFNGFMPGIALSILLTQTKFGSTGKSAAVAAIGVLLADDFLFQVCARAFGNAYFADTAANVLAYSLVCDFIGGAAAGVICRWLSHKIAASIKAAQPIRSVGRVIGELVLTALIVSTAVIIVYLVFLHPLPERVALDIRQQHSLVIRYGFDTDATLPSTPAYIISNIPLSDLHITTLAGLNVVGPNGPALVKGTLIGARGCASASDAADAALRGMPAGTPVDLSRSAISLIGSLKSIDARGAEQGQQAATISVSNGDLAVVMPVIGKSGYTIGFSQGSSAYIPVSTGSILILGVTPGAGTGALEVRHEKEQIFWALKEDTEGPTICRTAPLVEIATQPPSASRPMSSDEQFFIITITEAAQVATLEIGLANALLSVPVGFPLANRNKETSSRPAFTQVSYVKADVDDGELTIGGLREQLFPNDTVVLTGRMMTLGQPTDSTMTVTGDLPYVMLNGRVLNESLFESLSHEIQGVIVGGMITAIGWFVTNHWNAIKKILF